jgi:uncharacterized protein (DUF111 family)
MMVYVNALLDCGVDSSTISDRVKDLIEMPIRPMKVTMCGVLGMKKEVDGGYGRVTVHSHHLKLKANFICQVVPDPVGDLPPSDRNELKKDCLICAR